VRGVAMVAGDLVLIVLSFVPGLVFLALVARYDRAVRPPRRYLLGVFALGMFSVIPAALLEMAGSELLFGRLAGSPAGLVLTAFLLIGPLEEICNFLAVRAISASEHFEDPLDGVVYAVAAAMGFASLENAFYVSQLGWEVFWARALLAFPGHLVFASFWGYELGRSRFGLGGHVGRGLALAAFFHGLYNALLVVDVVWLGALVVPLLVGLGWVFRRHVRELRALARGAPLPDSASGTRTGSGP
jgi:protease PrsW